MNGQVRFLASADSRFFVGAVAMLNSLRLSGHSYPAFVVDLGFSPDQRKRIEASAQLLTLPPESQGMCPPFTKITADLFWSDGVVVLLDSDMIVTAPLDDLTEQAAAGRIAVHPDHEMNNGRQFPDWVETFGLEGPLRPQQYVNTAPVAVSLDRWPAFLDRWRRACLRLPDNWMTGAAPHCVFGDQDALNAVLMSEIPADALWVGSQGRTVHADGLSDVEVVDARTLSCRYRGGSPLLLHYGLSPKVWEQPAWSRVRPDDAYLRLLPRVLFADDLDVRARLGEVPVWLWPRGVGYATAIVVRLMFVLGLMNRLRRSRDRFRALGRRLVSSE
jgi:hypothetical protein